MEVINDNTDVIPERIQGIYDIIDDIHSFVFLFCSWDTFLLYFCIHIFSGGTDLQRLAWQCLSTSAKARVLNPSAQSSKIAIEDITMAEAVVLVA